MVGIITFQAEGPAEGGKDIAFNDLSISAEKASSPPVRIASPPTQQRSPTGIDTLEIAIDFVLALEHPCMAHIPYPADPGGEDPANHMMLVRCFSRYTIDFMMIVMNVCDNACNRYRLHNSFAALFTRITFCRSL